MPKNKDGGWKRSIWNSDTGELFGRTGGSWFKILLFYLIFYIFLAAVFIGTIQAMLMTLSDFKPTWQDRVSPPGLTHTPNTVKTELAFNQNDIESYIGYTETLSNFLAKYDDENQQDSRRFDDCGEVPDVIRYRGELEGSRLGVRKACRFSRSLLGPCSGIDDKNFGFNKGQPCIIVKLNRIINFRPMPRPTNESIPEEVWPKVQPNVIPIYCTNKKEEDAGKMGEVKYYGIGEGFPLQYYPYYGKVLHPHYLQPLVALQFVNITRNYELSIKCQALGANIETSEKDRYKGRFEIKFFVSDL